MTPEETILAESKEPAGRVTDANLVRERMPRHRYNGVNSKLDDALFNAVDPDSIIKSEKAWHRRAIDMAVQGYSIQEIANYLGFNRNHVEVVLKQPWAQQRMIETSKKSVQDEMKEFLEAEVMPSLRLIKEIRDDTKLKAEVRSEQATKLLNRFLGKEVQPMTTISKEAVEMTTSELTQEAQRILERQREQDNSRVPSPSDNPQ